MLGCARVMPRSNAAVLVGVAAIGVASGEDGGETRQACAVGLTGDSHADEPVAVGLRLRARMGERKRVDGDDGVGWCAYSSGSVVGEN
jgi:hypothetical protein